MNYAHRFSSSNDPEPRTSIEEDYEREYKRSTADGATSRAAHMAALEGIRHNAYEIGGAAARREIKSPIRDAAARLLRRISEAVRP